MIWNFADLFETIAARIPDRTALIDEAGRTSWAAFEDRAARLASALQNAGVGKDTKVAIYGQNSSAYVEAQFAIFKCRAIPINVNYRYVRDELHYLFENADVDAVFYDSQYGPLLAEIRDELPKLKTFICIDDSHGQGISGSLAFEDLVQASARAIPASYAEDDTYMLYTGGTTGMPKGVVYRHSDLITGLLGTMFPPGEPVTPQILLEQVEASAADNSAPVSFPACPMMHATGMWMGVFRSHFIGGAVVTSRSERFDPGHIWRTVEQERVTSMAIVGDAFARPLLAGLEAEEQAGRHYDLSSLKAIGSSGVMFSAEVKRGLLRFADVEIRDAIGSTEGSMGSSIVSRTSPPGPTAQFRLNATTKVFNDADEEVVPGSDEIGMIANGGFVPLAYYKDPEKSARTFRTIRGKRYSFPGDHAKVAADGTLILLGRGSACINTGGEKVFPEEVEEVLKSDERVWDALVVGVPDDRFGQKVVAIASLSPGHQFDADDLLQKARNSLAGYKLPRAILQVDRVKRAENGKADYGWARQYAESQLRKPSVSKKEALSRN
ncbi:MAG: acyl-CoA synthetase [Parvibaculaceae bacterium]